MTAYYLNSDVDNVTASLRLYTLGFFDSLFVGRDADVALRGSNAVFARLTNLSADVTLAGRIWVPLGQVVAATSDSSSARVFVTESALLRNGSGGAISLNSSFNGVVNQGVIHGSSSGVQFFGNDNTLLNAGLITGGAGDGAVFAGGTGNCFVNTGILSGGRGNGSGLLVNGGGTELDNSGSVLGLEAPAVLFFNAQGAACTVHNSGLISSSGGNTAVDLSNGADTVSNAGTIVGGVQLGDGDDLYDGTLGLVRGAVQGEGGADTIQGGAGGERLLGQDGDDLLEGNGGGDTLQGGAGSDELRGGEGNDVLSGGAGGDLIEGGAGIDLLDYATDTAGVTVDLASGDAFGGEAAGDEISGMEWARGGTGNDRFVGTADANRLWGGAGNDQLFGQAGADRLIGGEGNDTLTGGAGADVLVGGPGNDRFVFAALADSTVAPIGRDRILDFAPGDKIDLSPIDANAALAGNQAFTLFRAALGFLDHTPGQVRAVAANGVVLVQVEVTGDTVADLAFTVAGVAALAETDFIL
jgi:Ca2+-binding RTX toxin-like protein